MGRSSPRGAHRCRGQTQATGRLGVIHRARRLVDSSLGRIRTWALCSPMFQERGQRCNPLVAPPAFDSSRLFPRSGPHPHRPVNPCRRHGAAFGVTPSNPGATLTRSLSRRAWLHGSQYHLPAAKIALPLICCPQSPAHFSRIFFPPASSRHRRAPPATLLQLMRP